MRKEDKNTLIEDLAANIKEYSHFYVTDTAGLDAEKTSNLRRACFNEDIKLLVVKNTLFKKALEQSEGEYDELYDVLKGTSAIFFSNTGNSPAKLISKFKKGNEKPVLKGAFVEECVYLGENQLDVLKNIKSREELIGEIVTLLQSPAKNVVSALQSGGGNLHGLLQAIGEKNN